MDAPTYLNVATVGCTHGELDVIYSSIALMEKETNTKIDLVLCLGDFQAVRDAADLETMV